MMVAKTFESFEEAVSFLKQRIPQTNIATINLLDELRYFYPLTTKEKTKFLGIISVSAFAEVGLNIMDIFTDFKLTLRRHLDQTCHCFYGTEDLISFKSLGRTKQLEKFNFTQCASLAEQDMTENITVETSCAYN